MQDDHQQQLAARLGELTQPVAPSARAALKNAVSDYAAGQRARGWPPERVIVALKQIAREAGLAPTFYVTVEAHMSPTDQLLIDMVGWCIEAYFGPRS